MIVFRFFLILLLLCSVTYAPLFVTVVLVCAYSLYFRAYELIPLGLFVDAFYGAGFGVPYYLMCATVVFLAAEWIKPRLLMYNR